MCFLKAVLCFAIRNRAGTIGETPKFERLITCTNGLGVTRKIELR